MRSRRPRWVRALRSSDWARQARVRRFGAALLILAFAIGSILARDGVVAERARTLQLIAASSDVTVAELSIGDRHRRAELKLRPSGISKRAAWSPTDPPDDDDETDDDSDTLGAAHARVLPVDVAARVVAACIVDAGAVKSGAGRVTTQFFFDQPRVRGPPRV